MSGTACANCGTTLIGAHCHACGQSAHVHRTLGAIGHDLAHGVFHFEGKIAATLPLLAWRPGELTRRYVHGERAKFVSPLALFLFCVFVTFFVFSHVGSAFAPKIDPKGQASAHRNFEQARARNAALRRDLIARREGAIAAHQATKAIDAKLADVQSDDQAIDIATGIIFADGSSNASTTAPARPTATAQQALTHALAKFNANRSLALYKLQSSAYKYSWALIPLSLPLMWLLFATRREHLMYDHTVFVTYSLSAVMLLLVLMALLNALSLPWKWLVLLVPLHWFVQLKGAYRLNNRGAAWRTVALLVGTFFTLLLFGALMLVLGLA